MCSWYIPLISVHRRQRQADLLRLWFDYCYFYIGCNLEYYTKDVKIYTLKPMEHL